MIVEGDAGAGTAGLQPAAHAGSANLRITRELGDNGGALDSRARAEYRRRLNELRTELAQAEEFNDLARAERLRAEVDFLTSELSAASGLGGRKRKSGAHAERARLMVSKNIRSTIDKIRRRDPSLGHHFGACVKTGYFCAYVPEPGRPVSWQL
ncbi:MAG TPA: hypothetical protein VGY99_13265 [Candidatus Binataceae bacterium]|jgi:hypothetical protein|nr:hypothetical protein [Candidatus Binataceae bacterium]